MDDNWKKKTYVVGLALGALAGVATAYLLIRTTEESASGGPPSISTGDFIKSAVGIVGLMRGIAALGDR